VGTWNEWRRGSRSWIGIILGRNEKAKTGVDSFPPPFFGPAIRIDFSLYLMSSILRPVFVNSKETDVCGRSANEQYL
jgi:hypothetical protein